LIHRRDRGYDSTDEKAVPQSSIMFGLAVTSGQFPDEKTGYATKDNKFRTPDGEKIDIWDTLFNVFDTKGNYLGHYLGHPSRH